MPEPSPSPPEPGGPAFPLCCPHLLQRGPCPRQWVPSWPGETATPSSAASPLLPAQLSPHSLALAGRPFSRPQAFARVGRLPSMANGSLCFCPHSAAPSSRKPALSRNRGAAQCAQRPRGRAPLPRPQHAVAVWSGAGGGASPLDHPAAATSPRAAGLQVAAGVCSGHSGGQPDWSGAVQGLGRSFSKCPCGSKNLGKRT